MSRLTATDPRTAAAALGRGLRMVAAGELRPETTVVGGLEAVAAVPDLLAAGRGSGMYVVNVDG